MKVSCTPQTFTKVEKDDGFALRKQFFGDFKKTTSALAQKLFGVLNKNSKQLKMGFFRSETHPFYLIMISSNNDQTLIRLAKDCRFPRGFPLIWTPGHSVVLYGFHPKFDNDDRQKQDVDKFSDAEILQIMLKFSGFLGQVIVWDHEDTVYWTVTSKNSIGNTFADDAARIVAPLMTEKLIQTLHDDRVYFCGEVMSFNDQCHGARVLTENIVVTCVGQYQIIAADPVDTDGKETKAFPEPVDTFSYIFGHEAMHKYCVDHGLPVSDIWVVTDNIVRFMQEMSAMRDCMRMQDFRRLTEQSALTQLKGNILHEDILGDILEGFVMWKTSKCGEVVVKKWKLPEYTSRTFGLRAWISQQTGEVPVQLKFLGPAFHRHVMQYVDHWVLSEKKYWTQRLQTIALQFHDTLSQPENPIGDHIRIADWGVGANVSADVSTTFREKSGLKPITGTATVIVVVGPIGYGKSTIAEHIAITIRRGVHIDGDHPGPFSAADTLKLGKERNGATIWAIMSVLSQEYTPVVSTGGGALFTGFSFALKDAMEFMLGLELDLRLYAPVEGIYPTWDTRPITEHRLATGQWTLPRGQSRAKFLDKIQTISERNVQFCNKLRRHANSVDEYHPIRDPIELHHSDVPEQVVPFDTQTIDQYAARQVRLVTKSIIGKTESFGHITLHYSDIPQTFTRELVDKLHQLTGNTYDATMLSCKDWSCLSVPAAVTDLPEEIDLTEDNIHVTLNAGKHAAAEMKQACQSWRQGDEVIKFATKPFEYKHSDVRTKPATVTVVGVSLLF